MDTATQTFKLTDLIDTDLPSKGVWVQFKNTSFYVRVAFYGKMKALQVGEKSKITEFSTRTLQEKETIDNDKFRKEYASAVIKDWKGLTVDVLEKLIPVSADKAAGIPVDYEFPCEPAYKELLLQHSIEFDSWLQGVCTNVETFNAKKKDEETKNS